MSVPAAYIALIIIWSTTPLAIKWSSVGAGYMFGVTSRMALGLFVCWILIAFFSRKMPWHKQAVMTYLAAGLGLWGAMVTVYWAALYIPSGLISVVYGFLPVVTGVMAGYWLGEKSFTPFKILGMALGIVGLAVIFDQAGSGPDLVVAGLVAVVISLVVQSASTVWVKKLAAGLPPLEITTGSLLVAMPLFLLTWWLTGGEWPESVDTKAIWSIVYLGVIGSVLGFILYFYVLHHVEAAKIALITLITPVMALLIGQWLNDEIITIKDWLGAVTILIGLASYLAGDQLFRRLAESKS